MKQKPVTVNLDLTTTSEKRQLAYNDHHFTVTILVLMTNRAVLRNVGPQANVITGTPACMKDLNL